MKRIFLVCTILATSFTVTLAQSELTAATAEHKATFTSKLGQLNSFLSASDSVNAKAMLNEMNHLMAQQLGESKDAIANATSETAKSTAFAKLRQEQIFYSKAMNASHLGIIANRDVIKTNLQGFLQTY